MGKIKVLLADDHPAFREGLCRLLEDEADLEIVGKSADGEEAVSLAKELKPDVVLIDVSMPRLNGIEATKKIKEACPSTAVLVFSAYNYPSYVLASLQAGAAGYLLKSSPLRELVYAVRMVHVGEAVFDMNATKSIFARIAGGNRGDQTNLNVLHDRELEVLKLAAQGLSNKDIGKALSISERTVQTHLVHIFRKLGVGSRTEALLQALKKGLVILDDLV